jgi:carbon monoxide dehydrogenase subunit G
MFRRFRMRSRTVVNRPLADVWRFLSDLPRVATWEQGVLECRQTSPGAPAVGTTLVVRHTYFRREALIQCRITEWDELQGVTMAVQGGPMRRGTIRYAVEPMSSERTAVIFTGEAELIPALRILTPLMPALGQLTERGNFARLKRRLETPDQPAPGTAAS